MYCLRVKILTLETIGYSLDILCGVQLMGPSGRIRYILYIYLTVWDRYMQVLYLGRAPRTKETLPDFLK